VNLHACFLKNPHSRANSQGEKDQRIVGLQFEVEKLTAEHTSAAEKQAALTASLEEAQTAAQDLQAKYKKLEGVIRSDCFRSFCIYFICLIICLFLYLLYLFICLFI
jgi:hypothetical protein